MEKSRKIIKLEIGEKGRFTAFFITLITVLVAVGLNLVRIFDNNFWGDEAFSILLVKESFGEIIRRTAADVHPPLYYFILKLFCHVGGHTPVVFHFVSLLPVLLLLVFSLVVIRRHYGAFVASAFNLMIGLSSLSLYYNVEVRMYSWGLVFIFLAAYAAMRIMEYPFEKNISAWAGLLISGIGCAYTHYYTLISVVFVYLFLLGYLICKKAEIKSWFVCVLRPCILYLPWLLVLLQTFKRISGGYWIEMEEVPTLYEAVKYPFSMASPVASQVITIVFVVLLLLYCLIQNSRLQRNMETLKPDRTKFLAVALCCVSYLGTYTFGMIVSKLFFPVLFIRYLFPAAALIFFAYSLILSELLGKHKFVKAGCLLVTAVTLLWNYQIVQKSYVQADRDSRAALEYIQQNIAPTYEKVVVETGAGAVSPYVLDYYVPEINCSTKMNEERLHSEEFWNYQEERTWLFLKEPVTEERGAVLAEYYTYEEYGSQRLGDAEFYIYHCQRQKDKALVFE